MEDTQQPLQVEIDEPVARGQYTNLALITHSETEFILDYLFLQPQATKTKVLARLITSPVHAKRLLWALKDNVEKYEARHGAINAGQGPAEPRAGVYQ
ncbi:MAG: DUF3467 domain-containing protein [Elusimicrobiota bacterium]|nr:MAG: DUF3467 domain-containing protein [Elusimicrobiota bacterium]